MFLVINNRSNSQSRHVQIRPGTRVHFAPSMFNEQDTRKSALEKIVSREMTEKCETAQTLGLEL